MAGYKNFSMSNNAAAAYAAGKMPRSKWTRAEILECLDEETRATLAPLTVSELREVALTRCGWHHTGSKYARTDFYRVDDVHAAQITAERVAEIVRCRKARQAASKAAKAAEPPKERRALCVYTVWEGTRKHPHPRDVQEVLTIPAGDGLLETSNGKKRRASVRVVEWID